LNISAKFHQIKIDPYNFELYLTAGKSAASVGPYHTCPVAFRSLSALEQLQGPHHQWHIRRLSGVWSGTMATLHRTSVQLSKQPNATHSGRFVGWPSRGRRLPQPGKLTKGDESPGYHNNNNVLVCPLSVTERFLLQPLICRTVFHRMSLLPPLSPSSAVVLNHISPHFLIPLPDSSLTCTVSRHSGRYNCYFI